MDTQFRSKEQLTAENYVHEAISQIINAHIYHGQLNELVHQFIAYKKAETSIWPKLTLYTHHLLGGTSSRIHHTAAQTELIILSLDILDDLQDQDNTDPPWMSCDHPIAINAATALLTAAIAGNMSAPALSPAMLQLITAAHNGQHRDIGNEATDEEQYLQMVSEKSSSLIKLAILMGCPDRNAMHESQLDLLSSMAANIGVAAQLENDIKNITRIDYRNDLVQRKITLSTLFLLEQSDTYLPILRKYYNENCEQQQFLTHKLEILDFIEKSGVIEYTNAVQMLYAQQASEQLNQLQHTDSYWKNQFEQLAIARFLKKN